MGITIKCLQKQSQQAAWLEVVRILNQVAPLWYLKGNTSQESAVEVIKNFSEDNRKLQEENRKLREALTNTLGQCIGWQGKPNEYSCTVHKMIVEQAREALGE